MEEGINFEKMRKELIEIYSLFIRNPTDQDIQDRAFDYDRIYGALPTVNEIFKSQPIPQDIAFALNHLSTIIQYDLGTQYTNESIINFANRALVGLKQHVKDGEKKRT